jgi:hypothetical protein
MRTRNYFILPKETANFCFFIHFSYLSVTKVNNRTHDIAPSSCATVAQITTIITITTR